PALPLLLSCISTRESFGEWAGSAYVLRVVPKDRAPGTYRKPRTASARLPPPTGCSNSGAVVPFGPRCRAPSTHIIDVSWSCSCQRYLLVSDCLPRVDGIGSEATGKALGGTSMSSANFPALLQKFFTER